MPFHHRARYGGGSRGGVRLSVASEPEAICKSFNDGYNGSASFRFFIKALLSAQYFFMRAATARRAPGVHDRAPARGSAAGVLRIAGLADTALDDGVEPPRVGDSDVNGPVGGFVAALPARGRFGRAAGAISIPNIPSRSSLASTFAPAGPLRVFERSDPAFAIKSCWLTLRSVNSSSG